MRYSEPIEKILKRIDATIASGVAGFPHIGDPNSGRWMTSADGDWTGGFWPGMLWLAALYTDDAKYKHAALRWAKKLKPRASSQTVFRCFLFYYGAALGDILFKEDTAKRIGIEGAIELSKQFNPRAGLIPLGPDAEEASSVGNSETNIDGVMSVALLTWGAKVTGNQELADIGRKHALAHINLCIRKDFSVSQSATFSPSNGEVIRRYTHKGYSDQSTWARAQAWAMLGYSLATISTNGNKALKAAATKLCDWWLDHIPNDYVPFWDFDHPDIPNTWRDTSAAAIASASMLKLASILGVSGSKYLTGAQRTVESLVNGFLTPVSMEDGRQPGMLTGGCYNGRMNYATNNELVWGDYYLLESLLVLKGKLRPSDV